MLSRRRPKRKKVLLIENRVALIFSEDNDKQSATRTINRGPIASGVFFSRMRSVFGILFLSMLGNERNINKKDNAFNK